MSQSVDDRVSYLLKQYIANACTHEEYQELLALLKVQTDNTPIEELLLEEVHNSGYHEAEEQVNWQQMLQTVLQQQEVAAPAPVRAMGILRKAAIAAVVVVCMGVIVWWWLQKDYHRKAGAPSIALTTDIMPGKNGAILTLGNGQQLVLDSANNGALTSQAGLHIIKHDSLIAYSPLSNHTQQAAEIAYNTLATPRGRQFRLVLADGTKVWLNAASSIRYPAAFNDKERVVNITGEVYFEVAPVKLRSGRKMPFIVKIDEATEVKVLGTHFNINAYHDEANVKVTLLEGSVKVGTGNETSVVLKPGEQTTVSQSSQPSQPIPVQTDAVMAWKNGFFQFERADIQTVMRQIARWYDVDIQYEGPVTKDRFGGSIPRDATLSQVLHALEQSLVHFTIQGKKVIVTQ
jgi:transmembrane sensor